VRILQEMVNIMELKGKPEGGKPKKPSGKGGKE
jgi:hypothetical protein